MKKFRYIAGIVGVLTFVLSVGCVEKFEANIGDVVTEGLVIEGDIISDSTVVFKLSKTLPLTETEENEGLFNNYLVVGADLAVKGSDGSSWSGFSWKSGEYIVPIGTLQPDVEYHLEIQYGGDTYQSEPQKPLPCSEIDKMTFSQPDLLGPVSIRLDSKESDLNETKYYLWYFEEDWEVRAHYASTDLYDIKLDEIIHYPYPPVAQGWCYRKTDKVLLGTTESNLENRMVGKLIHSIEHTDYRLSVLYSIRVQQRNLTRKEYEYYQVRNKLNNDMGGLFTPQPSELPTNVTCSDPKRKVIGYVGCNMGVAYYQLYIPEDKVHYLEDFRCDAGEEPSGKNEDKYAAGFQIGSLERAGNEVIIEWARVKCVDVKSLGANPLGRPEWWPNPYLYYPYEQGPDF